jgi:hypothetical protein
MMQELRQRKSELLAYLRDSRPAGGIGDRYHLVRPGARSGGVEVIEIQRNVEQNGVCLVFSHVLNDFVAFYVAEADKAKIPAGFTAYSERELMELFGPDKPELSPEALRRVHRFKKEGLRITGNFPKPIEDTER